MRKAKKVNPSIWRFGYSRYWNLSGNYFKSKNNLYYYNFFNLYVFLLKFLNIKFNSLDSRQHLIDFKLSTAVKKGVPFLNCIVYIVKESFDNNKLNAFFRLKRYSRVKWKRILKLSHYSLMKSTYQRASCKNEIGPFRFTLASLFSRDNLGSRQQDTPTGSFSIYNLKKNYFYQKISSKTVLYKKIRPFFRTKKFFFLSLDKFSKKWVFLNWAFFWMNFKKINKIFSLARKIKYFSKFTILASPLFNFFLWFYSKKVPNHLHSPRNFIVPDNINSTVFLAKLKTSYLFKYFNLKIKTLFLSKLFLKKNKNSVFNFLKKKTFYFKKTLKPKYNLKYFYAKISFYKSGNFNNFIAATSFSRALKRSFLLGKYKKKKLRNIKRRQLIFKHNLKKKKKYITKIKKSYISSLLRLINLFYFQKCRPTPINSTISHTFSFRKETEALKGRIFNQDSSYNNFKKIWFYKKENISGFKAYYFSLPFHDIKHLNYSFKHTLEPKLKTTNEELWSQELKKILKLPVVFKCINVSQIKMKKNTPQANQYKSILEILPKVLTNSFYYFRNTHTLIRKQNVIIFFEVLIFSLLIENYILCFHLLSRLLKANRKHRKNFSFIMKLFQFILTLLGKNPILQINLTGRPGGVDRRTTWQYNFNILNRPLTTKDDNIEYNVYTFKTFASAVSLKIWRFVGQRPEVLF